MAASQQQTGAGGTLEFGPVGGGADGSCRDKGRFFDDGNNQLGVTDPVWGVISKITLFDGWYVGGLQVHGKNGVARPRRLGKVNDEEGL